MQKLTIKTNTNNQIANKYRKQLLARVGQLRAVSGSSGQNRATPPKSSGQFRAEPGAGPRFAFGGGVGSP